MMALCIALSSCGNEPPPPQESGKPVTSLAEVAGSWDIIRFGDYVPPRIDSGGVRRAYVNFGDEGVGSHIECNHYSGTNGEFDEEGTFLPVERPDEPMISTMMLCPPEMDAREGRLAGFFRMTPSARWVDDGMVELTGVDGFTILLQRPNIYKLSHRVKPAELEGEWRPVARMSIDENGYSGSSVGEDAGFVRFAAGRMTYSKCPDFAASYGVGEDGLLRLANASAALDALEDCTGFNDERVALRPLFEEPFLEHAGEDRFVADADGAVLALTERSAWEREQADIMAGIVRDEDGNPIPPPPAQTPPLPTPPSPPPPTAIPPSPRR